MTLTAGKGWAGDGGEESMFKGPELAGWFILPELSSSRKEANMTAEAQERGRGR